MPELPEVETVRRGLESAVVGRTVVRVEARRPDLRFPLPERFDARLRSTKVEALNRRAKYLIMALSSGDELVMHLGMTGRFTVCRDGSDVNPGHYVYDSGADPRHDHVILHFDDGMRVVYNDPRRFGFMVLVDAAARDAHPLFANMGVEPLGNDWSADYLAARAAVTAVTLKAFLMDQRVVAGLGNIYVSEALHRAGLSPQRKARSLSDRHRRPTDRAHRLTSAVREVLTAAVAAGGSTLRDYRHADGSSGDFQDDFRVYDRGGQACARPGCQGTVRRIVQNGRATFYCGACQR